MSRITWRSRPRSEYPWPLPTKRMDAFPGGYPDADYLLGPFTMGALCELLFRAKGFTIEDATADYDDDPNELDMFEKSYQVGNDPGSVFGYYATAFGGPDLGFEFNLFEVGVTPWTGVDDDGICLVFHVGNSFYLRGSIEVTGLAGQSSNWGPLAAGGPATITFQLDSGSFPVVVFGDISTTFAVSKWLPFETTAGVAAWDTATGAPINGGPGA